MILSLLIALGLIGVGCLGGVVGHVLSVYGPGWLTWRWALKDYRQRAAQAEREAEQRRFMAEQMRRALR